MAASCPNDVEVLDVVIAGSVIAVAVVVPPVLAVTEAQDPPSPPNARLSDVAEVGTPLPLVVRTDAPVEDSVVMVPLVPATMRAGVLVGSVDTTPPAPVTNTDGPVALDREESGMELEVMPAPEPLN